MRSNLAEGLGVRRALKQLNDDTLTSAPAMLASPSTSSGSLAGPPPGLGFTPGSKTESGSTPSSPATNPKSKRRVARFAVLAWLVERRGSSKLVVAAAAALLLLAGECAEPCCIPCWSLFVCYPISLCNSAALPPPFFRCRAWTEVQRNTARARLALTKCWAAGQRLDADACTRFASQSSYRGVECKLHGWRYRRAPLSSTQPTWVGSS